jgi:hypothetical protein
MKPRNLNQKEKPINQKPEILKNWKLGTKTLGTKKLGGK